MKVNIDNLELLLKSKWNFQKLINFKRFEMNKLNTGVMRE